MTAIANFLSTRAAVIGGLTVALWVALIAAVKVLSFGIATVFATSENVFTAIGGILLLAAVYLITLKAVSARK